MTLMKKYAFYGAAVAASLALALVMLVSSTPRTAQAATTITPGAGTFDLRANSTNGTNNFQLATAGAANIVITETAVAQFVVGNTVVLQAPTGWQFGVAAGTLAAAVTVNGGSAPFAVTPVISADLSQLTLTVAAQSAGAAGVATIIFGAGGNAISVRPISAASVTGNITLAASSTAIANAAVNPALAANAVLGTVTAGTNFATPFSVNLGMTTSTGACAITPANPVVAVNPPSPLTPASVPADGSIGTALCATVRDAANFPIAAVPVSFSVSLGVVSTGTAKTIIAFTSTGGVASTNYRGGGGVVATDTAVSSAPNPYSAVGTLSISLTAPTGTTAAKVIVTPPTTLAVAATVTNTSPNYQSPTIGTNFSVQAQDGNGLGVNNQVLLVSVDRGALVAGFGALTCANATSKSITVTTATGPLVVAGTQTSGVGALSYCGNQLDAPGKATITVSNISTSMANATGTVSMAGRPAKVTAVATVNSIAATIVDAGGNAVADGTPVRFTISANAGAVSTACTTTTNGQASSVVALIAATGTVIVSTDWNESGAAVPGCAAAQAAGFQPAFLASGGAQSIATSVTVPGGNSSAGGTTPTTPTTPVAGTGAFAAAPVFSASKLANAVFTGTLTDAVFTAAGATGAWAQDSKGVFNLYVVGAPAFVNAGFLAAFPNNAFTTATALTLVGSSSQR